MPATMLPKKARIVNAPPAADAGLLKKLRFYRLLSAALFVAVAALSFHHVEDRLTRAASFNPRLSVQEDAPHSEFVSELIRPLRYSGLPDLMRGDVRLDVDFANASWALRNIHQLDREGNVVLTDGRYGVCGDLSAYVYQKIKPVFGDRFKIEFMEVSDSTFFKPGGGSHIILRIVDLAGGMEGGNYKSVYILDPALRRYGVPDRFPDYWPERSWPSLPFLEEKSLDETFELNQGPPILINRNAFVTLGLEAQDGKFDPDNYRLVVSLKRRYQYRSETIYEIGKKEGFTVEPAIKSSATEFLKPGDYKKLTSRVSRLFHEFKPADGGAR